MVKTLDPEAESHPSPAVTDPSWLEHGAPFKEINLEKLEGRNLASKIDMLMAHLSMQWPRGFSVGQFIWKMQQLGGIGRSQELTSPCIVPGASRQDSLSEKRNSWEELEGPGSVKVRARPVRLTRWRCFSPHSAWRVPTSWCILKAQQFGENGLESFNLPQVRSTCLLSIHGDLQSVSVIYSMFLQHSLLEKQGLLTCLPNERPIASLCAVNVCFLNQAALEQLGHQNRKVLTHHTSESCWCFLFPCSECGSSWTAGSLKQEALGQKT